MRIGIKLAKTVDYETTKNLNITVRVTDANSHTFDKAFTFNIANVNDEKVLSKVCELASVTLTVILRFLVVS
jgi:glycyl-tRNA synthetase (class II)